MLNVDGDWITPSTEIIKAASDTGTKAAESWVKLYGPAELVNVITSRTDAFDISPVPRPI